MLSPLSTGLLRGFLFLCLYGGTVDAVVLETTLERGVSSSLTIGTWRYGGIGRHGRLKIFCAERCVQVRVLLPLHIRRVGRAVYRARLLTERASAP